MRVMEKALTTLTLMFSLTSANLFAATLMISVEVKDRIHTVERMWVIEQNFPPFEHGLDQGKYIIINITDIDGNSIVWDKIPDPTVMRGVLDINIPNSTHGEYEADLAAYTLRYRYEPGMHLVTITELDTTQPMTRRSNTGFAPPKKVIEERILLE
ncbi:hypothetical protein CS022_06615 [Veronia nyctiphanis]|uniref:Uncharacterized protein n=1 Tax=Veronia nyctiphanis TaxID=1278244 RepID=A0A4V1LT48_9GAMM|nr:hypothetical protein [Veronia nyctiphanis]RXJ73948.1 hypothetical protein CS022_06615 [Veronia nyctiphanis]